MLNHYEYFVYLEVINKTTLNMKWFIKAIELCTDFEGRAHREEYWMFVLFNIIFGVGLSIIDSIFGLKYDQFEFGILSTIYSLLIFIPALAAAVRRLHDTGKSGWWMLLVFVPILGAIWLVILLATEGEHGKNSYGENPRVALN